MMGYDGHEFATLAILQQLALMSPGPDFAIVVKHSLTGSRSGGLWASLGVSLGILVHLTYSLFGIALLIQNSPTLFTLLHLGGGGYLIFLGCQGIRAQPHLPQESHSLYPLNSALRQGFLTNVLNPKCTLFMVTLFSVVVDPSTPSFILGVYALYIWISTLAWFATIALLFSSGHLRSYLATSHHWLERMIALFLLALGVKVILLVLF